MIAAAAGSNGFLEMPSCPQPHNEEKVADGGLAKIREILQPAYLHAEKMRGKKAVLFLGNTGAGKSTAISILMGAKIISCTNAAGEKALSLAEEVPIDTYPKIGRSLNISETIYTQGYQPVDADFIFVDCAGFGDTRGANYELIRKIGLEQACSLAHQICSLVLVIPAWAFLEKGNGVVDLMTQVQAHFPEAFSLIRSERTPPIHVLVTKSDQVMDETPAKLQDGTRLRELVRELQDQLHAFLMRGSTAESFEVQSIQKRATLWQSLQEIQKNGFFQFIDPKNRKQRRELVAAYTQKGMLATTLKFEKNFTKESLRALKRPLKGFLLSQAELRRRISQLDILHEKVIKSQRKIHFLKETSSRAQEKLNHLNEVSERVITISQIKDSKLTHIKYAQLVTIWRELNPIGESNGLEPHVDLFLIKIFCYLQEREIQICQDRFNGDKISKAYAKLYERQRSTREICSLLANLPRASEDEIEFLRKVASSVLEPGKIKPSSTSFMNLLNSSIESQDEKINILPGL